MDKHLNLSIILPAYNEASVIGQTLESLAAYLRTHPELGPHEVIVVAAGTDETPRIARTYAGQFDALHVITPPERAGKGRDVRLGFQAARGRFQLFTDADLSTPLHHIGEAVQLLEAGNDVVIGRRNLARIHTSRLRALVSVASNRFIRLLLLPGIRDSQCGFKAFRAEAAATLFSDERRINGWAFDVEILAAARKARCRIAQLPVSDWRETREDDLRNESMIQALSRTFGDVLRLRVSLWLDTLARHLFLLAALATLISGGLSLLIGMRQSVWFDEAYSAALIEHPITKLVQLTSVDVHPPLYYLLLKGWAAIFGNGDLALRSFSVLCGALAVGLGLLLVKRLWNGRVAVLAWPFAVAAPFVIRYSFEIRMYALASLLCMSATYVLVTAMDTPAGKRRTLRWILYAVLVAAGLYTLYYTALVWIAHFLWCLYVARIHHKVRWQAMWRQPWLAAFVLAAILFLPWVPVFAGQLRDIQGNFWIPPATYRRVVSVGSFFFSYLAEWQLDPWLSLMFMAAVTAGLYFIIAAFHLVTSAGRRALVLLSLYAVIPVVVLYCASLPPHQPVFLERYDSQAILSVYLLLGVSIAIVLRARASLLRILAALGIFAVLVAGVVTLYHAGNFSFDQLDKPTARDIAAYLTSHTAAGEPIVADGPYSYIELHHYLSRSDLLFYSPQPTSTRGGYAMLHDSPLRVASAGTFPGPVWLVYASSEPPFTPINHHRSYGTQIGRYRAYLYVPTATLQKTI